jgi:monofunctional biosynthetic peptidoglycan transglycosylase
MLAGIGFALMSAAWVFAYRYINPPTTLLMLIREADGVTVSRTWVDFEDLSGSLAYCAVRSEDHRFLDHFGFDFSSIHQKALAVKEGEFSGGGSTITQQVAKNCFLWPQRSWLRKGLEVPFALLIELMWSKERILEIYLNVAEMGDGIFGAEAAAQAHFNKSAADLTFPEAALLAAALPSPRQFDADDPAQRYLDRQAGIMQTVANSQTQTATTRHVMRSATDDPAPTNGRETIRYQMFGGFEFSLPEDCDLTGMEIRAELGPLISGDSTNQIVIGPAVQGADGQLQANAVPYQFEGENTTCHIGGPRMLPAPGWNVERVHNDTFGILLGTSEVLEDQDAIDPALVYVTVYFLPNWDTFDMNIELNF